ncbi:hypothetical protein NK6_3784 [Bradyrhizobium diazoefficiens]|uniref:Uncharacterized protein n=1 Tax=Bradyrhizobium diazoefficiens TaxID=1355477 RepID=A0A0E4BNV7_9BRAD|nr:hypothetical protein NK6_3784 [Bradyrhizobium diazoefficiens]
MGPRIGRLWMTRAQHGSFSSDLPSPAGHNNLPRHKPRIQAYCRQIVNQNKRIMTA